MNLKNRFPSQLGSESHTESSRITISFTKQKHQNEVTAQHIVGTLM